MKSFLYLFLFFIIACNTKADNKPAETDSVVQDGTLINDTSTLIKDTISTNELPR